MSAPRLVRASTGSLRTTFKKKGKSDLHDVKVCYLKVNMVHSGLAGRASLASKQALDKVRRRSARVQST